MKALGVLWLFTRRHVLAPLIRGNCTYTTRLFPLHLLHHKVIFVFSSEPHVKVHGDILVGFGAVEVFGHRFHLCSAPTESGEELKDFADGLTLAKGD